MPVLEVIIFWIATITAVVSGIGVIASPKPVYSAVSLIVTLGNLAILYLLLNAQFIAAAQVLIYAGAVMVLFLFVITLLGVREYELFGNDRQPLQRVAGMVLGAILLAGVIYFVSQSGTGMTGLHSHYANLMAQKGNVQAFGHELFNDFLLPFEVTPFLLVVAIVGAVALGKTGRADFGVRRSASQLQPIGGVSEGSEGAGQPVLTAAGDSGSSPLMAAEVASGAPGQARPNRPEKSTEGRTTITEQPS